MMLSMSGRRALASFSVVLLLGMLFSGLVTASENSSPVLELTPASFQNAIKERSVLVKFYANWCPYCKAFEKDYENLAAKFKDNQDVHIAQIDVDAHKEMSSKHEIGGLPTIKFFPKGKDTSDLIYFGSRSSHEDLVNFVTESLADAAKSGKPRVVRRDSQALPGPPLVVLGDSNFTEIVMNPDFNVLVKFYAPWCGHCKNMAPDYEKLAKAFENDEHVVIAKLDATVHSNSATKHGISGYPTIKFFPARKDNKEAVSYEGGRKLENMIAYINEKAGAYRASDGSLLPNAGVIPEMKKHVAAFYKAADKKSHLEKIFVPESAEIAKKFVTHKYYVHTGEFIVKRGLGFVGNEIARVEKLLSAPSKNYDATQLDVLRIRLNILKQFRDIARESGSTSDEL